MIPTSFEKVLLGLGIGHQAWAWDLTHYWKTCDSNVTSTTPSFIHVLESAPLSDERSGNLWVHANTQRFSETPLREKGAHTDDPRPSLAWFAFAKHDYNKPRTWESLGSLYRGKCASESSLTSDCTVGSGVCLFLCLELPSAAHGESVCTEPLESHGIQFAHLFALNF